MSKLCQVCLIEHGVKDVIFEEFGDFVVDVATIKSFALHQDLEGANVFAVSIKAEGDVAKLVDGTQERETFILQKETKLSNFSTVQIYIIIILHNYVNKISSNYMIVYFQRVYLIMHVPLAAD